jgi:hypothetical protein
MKKDQNRMLCSHTSHRSGEASPLIVKDLCAQLAPLNRYGPPDLGAVAVDGLRALIGLSRKAVGAAMMRPDSAHEIIA